MTQGNRLSGLAGVYKQNDGSTFVVLLKGNDLYLKIDSNAEEILVPGGDGLYRVGETNAKIKFNITSNSIAASLTFYLKDRQTVATKDLQILKERTFVEKFKDLGIAIVIFFALVGAFLISYSPMKKSCLEGRSKMLCRMAMVGAKVLGRHEDTAALSSQESKTEYTQVKEQAKIDCDAGKPQACLEIAKTYLRIKENDKAYLLLKNSCLSLKHGASCALWHEALINDGDVDEAYKLSEQACSQNIGLSCHQLAWKYKKENNLERSIKFFTRACDNGEAKSCHELGLHHLKFDRKLSYSFFGSACKSYHRQSCDFKEKLDRYFVQEKKCQEEKNARSCFVIASFEEDYGDQLKAMASFASACKIGSRLACDRVEKEKALKKLRNKKERVETI